MSGPGYNTFHGPDPGPPPPNYYQATQPQYLQYPAHYAPSLPMATCHVPPTYHPTGYYPPPPHHFSPYASTTHPAGPPTTDGTFPGIHLRNHTGGIGLPPGYDYLFPQQHCKIHVFKTPTKPWQPSSAQNLNPALHPRFLVPCTMGIKELMQQLGCDNDQPGKNILYEVVEKGNGAWASGLKVAGDDKDKMKKSIADFGWDASRTGHPGEKPVVWLWVTKSGV